MSCTQEIFIFTMYPLLCYRRDNLFIYPHQQKFACYYPAVGKALTQRTQSSGTDTLVMENSKSKMRTQKKMSFLDTCSALLRENRRLKKQSEYKSIWGRNNVKFKNIKKCH